MGAMSSFNPLLLIRGFQALFSLIILALFASVSSYLNFMPPPFHGTPGTIAFPIFIGVFTLLTSLPYLLLTPRYFPHLAHKHAMLAVELLTMTLWFVGWICPASYLSGLKVCKGGVCHTARAGTVLAVLVWVSFVGTSVLGMRYCGFLGGQGGPDVVHGQGHGHGHGHKKNISDGSVSISAPMPIGTSNGTGTPMPQYGGGGGGGAGTKGYGVGMSMMNTGLGVTAGNWPPRTPEHQIGYGHGHAQGRGHDWNSNRSNASDCASVV